MTLPIVITLGERVILPPDMAFFRILHEAELPPELRRTPPERPEVRPYFPNHHVLFGKYWQLLSAAMNPYCNPGNWTAIYHYRLWISNNQGYGMQDDPRANHVSGEHLNDPLPRVEALTCGGNLIHAIGETFAKTDGGVEECYIAECLDWKDAAPSVQWMDEHPWLNTYAVNLGGDLTPRRFEMGKQPNGYIPGVRHPFLADPGRYVVAIQKWRCARWVEPNPPDPYTLYTPV